MNKIILLIFISDNTKKLDNFEENLWNDKIKELFMNWKKQRPTYTKNWFVLL